MGEISKAKSVSDKSKRILFVTYARAIAVVSIFICHILFISDRFESSMWFNTGVPLFFIISAYLMSLKRFTGKDAILDFYKRRLTSILIPYELYLTSIIIALCIIGRIPTVRSCIMYMFGMPGFTHSGVLGLGHLWFITVLFICYAITPLLYRVQKGNYKHHTSLLLFSLIAQFGGFTLCGYPSYGIHVGSYCLIYLFFLQRERKLTLKDLIIWGSIAISTSIVRLALDKQIMAGDYTIYYYYDAWFQPLARFSLAMAIFCLCSSGNDVIEQWGFKHDRLDKCVQWFSGISYEFYLTHQFIMLSIGEFFPRVRSGYGIMIWIAGTLVLTIGNSVILQYIANPIMCKLNK